MPDSVSARAAWLLASCCWAGCGGREMASSTFQVARADSGGVELVTNIGLDALPTWAVDSIPTFSIGTEGGDGPDSFVQVVGALALADGSVLVSDLAAGAVRLFDRRGKFVRQVVRNGSGPAELRYAGPPTRFGGDSIAIFDGSGQGRVVLFDGKLAHLATQQLRGYRDGDRVGVQATIISSTEAIGHLIQPGPQPDQAGITRWPFVLGRLPFDGSRFDTIAVGRGHQTYRIGGGMGSGVPMGASPVFAVGATAVYFGDSDEAAIGVWRFDGRPVRRIRWVVPPDRTTPDDRDRAFAWDSANMNASPEIRRARPEFLQPMFARMRAAPLPAEAPRFTQLIPTEQGGLWIQRRPRPWLDRTEYLVADSSGAFIARIELSSRFTPFQIGPDWVLGRWRTADDVNLVHQYRLVR